MEAFPRPPFRVRSFHPSDQAACRVLYVGGLIGKTALDPNDTGFDMDDIEAAYMRASGNHFWVAEAPPTDVSGGTNSDAAENNSGTAESLSAVVGTIGVQAYDQGVGEIRRLRVAHSHRRRGIGSALMEAALRFCQDQQYLKITLDTYMDREPALKLFEKFRFRHDRTRQVRDKQLMYFYLDLYGGSDDH